MFDRLPWGPAGFAIGALAVSSCSERADEPLAAVADAEWNAALVRAIHDAGYLCDEVLGANGTDGPVRTWRIVCGDLYVYMAMLDENDALYIEPMPYVDSGAAGVSITRVRDVGAGALR